MSEKKSSMREGPLSELFRPTDRDISDAPASSESPEPPAWGRETPTYGERSNYLAVIKCVGVGGAGINAINRMIEAGIRGVEFIAVNTDRQSLDATDADIRIPVGIDLTKGRGTGGDPAMGEQAMRDSEDQIRRALRGADLVFIATGEGGGTGTGGAPVIAKLAREMGALTVAVVTRPFGFEGSRRGGVADQGVEILREQADTIIVIQNDRLLSVLDRGVSMVDAFRVCDDLLRQGVQGITDLITLPGLINLDFADVRTVVRGAGTALLGIGYATGATRAEDAAMSAISSPLLETPIDGAQGILLGITGGPDLSLAEISRAAKVVADAADPEANIIFGATVDPELEGKVWVTVVAAGFSGRRAVRPGSSADERSAASAVPTRTPSTRVDRAPERIDRPAAPSAPVAPTSAPTSRPSGPAPTFPPLPAASSTPEPPAEPSRPVEPVAPVEVSRPAEPPRAVEPPRPPADAPVEPSFTEIATPNAPDEPPEVPDLTALSDQEREEEEPRREPKPADADVATTLFGPVEDDEDMPTILRQVEPFEKRSTPTPPSSPEPTSDETMVQPPREESRPEPPRQERLPEPPREESRPEPPREESRPEPPRQQRAPEPEPDPDPDPDPPKSNPVKQLFRSLQRDRSEKDDDPHSSR